MQNQLCVNLAAILAFMWQSIVIEGADSHANDLERVKDRQCNPDLDRLNLGTHLYYLYENIIVISIA